MKDIIVNKPQFDTDLLKVGDFLIVKLHNGKVNCIIKELEPFKMKVIYVGTSEKAQGMLQHFWIDIKQVLDGTIKVETL